LGGALFVKASNFDVCEDMHEFKPSYSSIFIILKSDIPEMDTRNINKLMVYSRKNLPKNNCLSVFAYTADTQTIFYGSLQQFAPVCTRLSI
jgi:hypothetical protein